MLWGRPREDFRFNLINSKNNDNDDASQGVNDNIQKIEYGIKIVFGDLIWWTTNKIAFDKEMPQPLLLA